MSTPAHPMMKLFRYIAPFKTRFWVSITNAIINKIADLMPPVMVGWIIDTVTHNAPPWIISVTGSTSPWHLSIVLALIAIGVFGAESLFQWAYQYGFMTLAQKTQHHLRIHTYQQLQKQDYTFFENYRLGNTLSILNDDVNQLERFLYTGFVEMLHLSVVIGFAAIVMFNTSWQLASIGLLPLPFVIIGSLKYQSMISPWYQKVRHAVGELSSRLENNLSGILVIKSFTAEQNEYNRVKECSLNYVLNNHGVIKHVSLYVPLIRMIVAIGFAGVLLVGSYWILNGIPYITVGELVLFSMLTQRVLWPLTRFGIILDDFERANASAKRVFDLLENPITIQSNISSTPINHSHCSISFNNVHFYYDNQIPILNGINFSVPSGQTVGLAGTTGSGKSTLIKLALRLYEPHSGNILLNDIPIQDIDLTELRKQIALVSQDTYLFHGTIMENIAYGRPDATPSEIRNASNHAKLHDFVMTLPKQYNTIVGERGIKLSGGQRQRLSIARAILKNAPLMIFDEATSSVDTETEESIQKNIFKVTEGKTAIIIAHRLSTIRHANRILVIDNGQVAEEGAHDELLAQKGHYARLWKIQIGDTSSN